MSVVHPARPEDLDRLQEIEEAADRLLVELLSPDRWPPAADGHWRASLPGFVLVAEVDTGEVVGFVHVIEDTGLAHLDQLSVLPEHGRRGYGRQLVEAAMEQARTRGYAELTLRTYADIPWNGPFYARLGFVEAEPSTPFHQALLRAEAEEGIDRYGRRIQMSARLG